VGRSRNSAARSPWDLGIETDHGDADRFWGNRQGMGSSRRPTGEARGLHGIAGSGADWRGPTTSRLLCAQVVAPRRRRSHVQQTPRGLHRSDRGRPELSWTELTEAYRRELGFAAAAHPHDRDTFFVDHARPGQEDDADGKAASGARRKRAQLARHRGRHPPTEAHLGVLVKAWSRTPTTCPAINSARAPVRSSRARTTASHGRRSPATCRDLLRRRGIIDEMTALHLP